MINCTSAWVASGCLNPGAMRAALRFEGTPPPPGGDPKYGNGPWFAHVTWLSVVIASIVVAQVGCVAPDRLSPVTAVTCWKLPLGSGIRAGRLDLALVGWLFAGHAVA